MTVNKPAPQWYSGRRMKPTASLLAGMLFAVTQAQAQDSGDAVLENPAPPVLDVLGAAAARDLGASEGGTVDLSAALPYRMSAGLTLTPALSVRYGDSKYMAAWFGVSPAQSQRSGLPAFDASSGFVSSRALLGARYRLNARVSLNLFAGMAFLLGDAADSPIVEEDARAIGGLTFQYAL